MRSFHREEERFIKETFNLEIHSLVENRAHPIQCHQPLERITDPTDNSAHASRCMDEPSLLRNNMIYLFGHYIYNMHM